MTVYGNSPSECGRAWIEIDLDALAHNAGEITSLLPEGCELMAVIKTDAYGHGSEIIAKRLMREGVTAFAVATAIEGVRLRENGIEGDILVLGYTHPNDAVLLSSNDLSQLVVDGAHAKSLDETGNSIRVHIAIDTGMHRLGIQPEDFDEIERVFTYANLTVEGIATHLASSDSLEADDIGFTELQMERFLALLDKLKSKGYDAGKTHAQSSYGVLNFPGIKCGYARAGIALYGVLSANDKVVTTPSLRPVLSLRAIVAQVRWIGAGESVSYSRIFTTDKPMKLATVSIGYADGVPRQISGKGGICIVNGRKVPIVGRVCMDMLMIDVTEVEHVAAGDVVTLIGSDGGETVRCEDFAAASGTITNDILCRLGGRLPRLYSGV